VLREIAVLPDGDIWMQMDTSGVGDVQTPADFCAGIQTHLQEYLKKLVADHMNYLQRQTKKPGVVLFVDPVAKPIPHERPNSGISRDRAPASSCGAVSLQVAL
jgi:hypothetical protein